MAQPPALERLKILRPELHRLFERAAEIQLLKAQDYADTDSYRNLRDCESMGIPAWKGVLVRLSDKFRRLANFARKETFAVKDESFRDTCLDVINYTAMLIVLFEQESAKKGIGKTLSSEVLAQCAGAESYCPGTFDVPVFDKDACAKLLDELRDLPPPMPTSERKRLESVGHEDATVGIGAIRGEPLRFMRGIDPARQDGDRTVITIQRG